MKKIVLFIAAMAIVSCENKPKDFVSLSGKIIDKSSDSLVIRNGNYSKTIGVNSAIQGAVIGAHIRTTETDQCRTTPLILDT